MKILSSILNLISKDHNIITAKELEQEDPEDAAEIIKKIMDRKKDSDKNSSND